VGRGGRVGPPETRDMGPVQQTRLLARMDIGASTSAHLFGCSARGDIGIITDGFSPGQGWEILALDAQGRIKFRVGHPGWHYFLFDPEWSPEGDRVIVWESRVVGLRRRSNLSVVALRTGKIKILPLASRVALAPSTFQVWAPQGSQILVPVRVHDGSVWTTRLNVMDASGHQPPITLPLSDVQGAVWQSDGRGIVADVGGRIVSIPVTARPSTPTVLATGPTDVTPHTAVFLSPAGHAAVWMVDHRNEDPPSLWVSRCDPGVTPAYKIDDLILTGIMWSQDGRYLVYNGGDSDNKVFVYDMNARKTMYWTSDDEVAGAPYGSQHQVVLLNFPTRTKMEVRLAQW
ncbi:MAG TPA: hypothetical protein VHR86_04170, partial [Armatimonadota bacterium]|nr:hypothetical protein [Armatimonadota bacterium]